MKSKKWIEDLKVGDCVMVANDAPFTKDFMGIVARTTKTMIVLRKNKKFRKSNGTSFNNGIWNSCALIAANPEATLAIANGEKTQRHWRFR